MKFNLSKSYTKNHSKTQIYSTLTLGIAVLTVAGLVLYDNNISHVLAQSNTINATETTTLATEQKQQSNSPPQLELIIQEQGKITNQRVLEVHPHPKIESTFVANSTILGNISAHDLGTYWATPNPNGSVHGKGHGIITTAEGEMVTWMAEGIGNTSPEGDVRFEGSLTYYTSSKGELSYLNNKVGIFVYEVDKEGNTSANIWEFK
jgi:hypothetical protein